MRGIPVEAHWSWVLVFAAGPLVTVALILLLGAAERVGEALGWPRLVVDVLGLLALGNVAVLLFNLVPALPLDGGQMLLAWLWRRSTWGAEAASRTLRRTGTVCIYLTVGVGIVLLATGRLFAGYIVAVAGLEILLMSWIYYRGMAAASARAARPSPKRPEVVGDLIRGRELSVPEGGGVNDFLDQVARARGLSTHAFAVMRDGELVGTCPSGLRIRRRRPRAIVLSPMRWCAWTRRFSSTRTPRSRQLWSSCRASAITG